MTNLFDNTNNSAKNTKSQSLFSGAESAKSLFSGLNSLENLKSNSGLQRAAEIGKIIASIAG